MSERTIQRVFKIAKEKANIKKNASIHTLRHSYATHLLESGVDTKHLRAQVGFIAVLHTWGRNLLDHPHIHCIVPRGGLSLNGKYWVESRKKFFISVNVLSNLFKKKFNAYMIEKYYEGSLNFEGKIKRLSRKGSFEIFVHNLQGKNWVVYSKPPFSTAEKVVEYLGRYINRVAISNNRIIKVEDGQVTSHLSIGITRIIVKQNI